MYVYPPLNDGLLGGDLVRREVTQGNQYFVIVTPSCDLEQGKAEMVILARCLPVSDTEEHKKYIGYVSKGDVPSANSIRDIRGLMGNNRKRQPDRYHFIPEFLNIPHLVVDFSDLRQIPLAKIGRLQRLASLDSPFAEELLVRFSRHYGRIGTPDLHLDSILPRLRCATTPDANSGESAAP